MSSVSAPVTRSFGERDTGSASTDDALDRSLHNRLLRTTKLSARREPWSRGESVATGHPATLISSPPRWLHDLSPTGLLVRSHDFL
jgi:hypothetical protein